MGPPQSMPSHGMPPGGMVNHPLIAAAREQERAYLDMLSRPPYSTDPILAQQVCNTSDTELCITSQFTLKLENSNT